MTEDELLGRFGVRPAGADLDEVRTVLADHTARERQSQGEGDTLVMKLCCVQLFAAGSLEDVLRIWAAKEASFDASISIDVQLLCGAGLEGTKRFLQGLSGDEGRAALRAITTCEAAGDFEGFSPAQRMGEYERYYGVRD